VTVFVAFGTPNFSIARNHYRDTLKKFGQESLVFNIGSEPLKAARSENPEIFSHLRGYGYWFWKPWIIEAAFESTDPGTLIFYTDIGVLAISSPQVIIDLVKDYTHQPLLRFWSYQADEERYWRDEQSNGAFFVVRNCDAGRKFVAEWKEYLRDPRILTDQPNEMGLPNLPGFFGHRHDQSILSVLATRDNIPLLRDPSQWGNAEHRNPPDFKDSERLVPYDFGKIFHHHRQRDNQIR